jgi:hypothetical protein
VMPWIRTFVSGVTRMDMMVNVLFGNGVFMLP